MPQNAALDHGQCPPLGPLAGMILCGGEIRRMGTSKAWLHFRGQPLLARTVEIVGRIASPIVVVAAREQKLPPLPPHVIRAEDARPERGPLEGLLAGWKGLPASCD